MRWFVACVATIVVFFGPVLAQDAQTLADIRQELTVLHVEVQKLKRELSTTGGAGSATTGGSALERINSVENELRRLTSMTEQLEFRIGQVVKDGTNRIGDLEFRLVELEGGDVSKLGETSTLGGSVGGAGGTTGGATTAPQSQTEAQTQAQTGGNNSELAVGETADFKRAEAALAAGDHTTAAMLFAQFNQTYPGGPMAAAAFLGRGKSLEAAGDLTEAARAYLEAFSAEPNGASAPDALYHLGHGLGRLGQTQEACLTLQEVGVRFPGGGPATQAKNEIARLGCS